MVFKNTLLVFSLVLSACSFQKNNKEAYPGYSLRQSKKVEAIGSEVVELDHIKSGARVVLIKNQDPARSFMVGFRTPPYDDTGLFHIFEHAVLEGSRLYPSKSNFFHLANSSVASYINASTGPVYTLYPFVTRSTKDFDNLLSVYMDAVFFPKVLQDPRIVKREGWRYEMTPDNKSLTVNGIVLSEMKGAFSSPYRSIWFQLARSMVPDTPFSFSSGGLPEKIASLSFEQIREAHKKYYQPQNSVIYLYGDLDFAKTLASIDEDFLSEFNKDDSFQRPPIPTQKNFNYETPIVKATYPGQIGPKKAFLAKGLILGEDLSPVEENAASVLLQAFVSNNVAPLNLRILKEGLASSTFNTGFGGLENGIALVFEGTRPEDLETIETVLNEEVDKIIKEGFDEELLNSIVNRYEFSYKEKNSNGSHKGMQLGSIVLQNWLYAKTSLYEDLDFVTQFKDLRKLLSDQQFIKNFFKKAFKDNKKSRWIVLTPDPDFSKKFNQGLEKLTEKALKEKPLEEWKKEDQTFKDWVSLKESDDIVGKTPTLKLKDIKADEKPIPYDKVKIGKSEALIYKQDTAGISYVNLYFDLSGLEEKYLKDLEFFTQFLKRMDTAHFDFRKLSKDIDTYVGGLGFGYGTYQSLKDPNRFRPIFSVGFRFIDENKDKTFALLEEILLRHQFSPESRLKELIDEFKVSMTNGVTYRAPSLAGATAQGAFFPEEAAFNSETEGAAFESYVLNQPFKIKPLQKRLQLMGKPIFNQDRLFLVAITSTPQDVKKVENKVSDLQARLPKEGGPNQKWLYKNQPQFDGFSIPGEVQYVYQVTSYKKQGLPYSGAMRVYSNYLNNHYMTPKLREQAGAYGGRAGFTRTGLFTMSTYKDPNLKKSFDIFSGVVPFMKKEKLDPEKLKPAILGSLKPYYKDTSVFGRTNQMTSLYLTDQTWDDYMKIKKEILATTPEQIQEITAKLEQALQESKKSVAGNPKKLKEEAPFLKKVLSFL